MVLRCSDDGKTVTVSSRDKSETKHSTSETASVKELSDDHDSVKSDKGKCPQQAEACPVSSDLSKAETLSPSSSHSQVSGASLCVQHNVITRQVLLHFYMTIKLHFLNSTYVISFKTCHNI